jgi:hypothetical protein
MWLAASLLLVVVMVLSSCAAPTPQVVEKVVTQVQTPVVEKQVVQTQVVEKKVEVQVTPTAGPANPYRPDDLIKLADALKAGFKDAKIPADSKYAL